MQSWRHSDHKSPVVSGVPGRQKSREFIKIQKLWQISANSCCRRSSRNNKIPGTKTACVIRGQENKTILSKELLLQKAKIRKSTLTILNQNSDDAAVRAGCALGVGRGEGTESLLRVFCFGGRNPSARSGGGWIKSSACVRDGRIKGHREGRALVQRFSHCLGHLHLSLRPWVQVLPLLLAAC